MKLNEMKFKKISSGRNPLYKIERKLNLKSLIVFTTIASLLTLIFTLLFPIIKQYSANMLESLKGNQEAYDALAAGLSGNSLGSYFVLIATQSWGFIGIIYAMYLSYKLMVENFKDGSYEMLYSLEMSRQKIVLTKYLRMVINLLIFNLVLTIFSFIGVASVGISQINIGYFVMYCLLSAFVTLQVGTIGFALSCIFKSKFNLIFCMLIAVIFYLIANFAILSSNLEFLEYLTPASTIFANIIQGGLVELNYISLIIWSCIPIVLLLYGIIKFKKSDLL